MIYEMIYKLFSFFIPQEVIEANKEIFIFFAVGGALLFVFGVIIVPLVKLITKPFKKL